MPDEQEATKSGTTAEDAVTTSADAAASSSNISRVSARASARTQSALNEKMALASPQAPRTSTNTRLSTRAREKADGASDATSTMSKNLLNNPTVRELDPASNRRSRTSREVLEGKMREMETNLGDQKQEQQDEEMPGAVRVSYKNNNSNNATQEPSPHYKTTPVTAISVDEENQELQDLRQRVLDLEQNQQQPAQTPKKMQQTTENNDNNDTTTNTATQDIPIASATAVHDNDWCQKRMVPIVAIALLVGLIALGVILLVDDQQSRSDDGTTIVVIAPTLAPSTTSQTTPIPSSRPSLALSQLPSMLPSSAKRVELEAILKDFVPLHQKAMDWLTNEDTWEPPPLSSVLSQEQVIEVWKERYILTVFFYDTNGDSTWSWAEEWLLSGRAACGWFGGTCKDFLLADLWIRNNGLSGTIPTLIGQLKKIRRLNLGLNDFKTTIPSEIGLLSELTSLNLFDCVLSGSIPSEIGNLVNLRELYLDKNRLVGSVPSEVGNLSILEKFYLSDNGLTGQIPSAIQRLTNLGSINFEKNNFTGIPTEIGALTNVKELSIYENQLKGSIPESIGNMSSLTSLYLYKNELSGSIPIAIANLTALVSIGLNGNMLTGAVPFFAANSSIWSCDLWDNSFNDTSKGELVGCDFKGTQP